MKKIFWLKLRKTFLFLTIALLFTSIFFVSTGVKAAADSKISFSPASQTVENNADFILDATINPGANSVSAVMLRVTFDQTKLRLDSITPSSAFSLVLLAASIDNNKGTALIDVAVPLGSNSVTTTSTVATFTFHSIATANDSPIDFTTLTQAAADGEAGNVIGTRTGATVTINGQGSDTTPPVLSNGAPTGSRPAGTTSQTISLSTNENATCRYSTSTGVAYASMNNIFSDIPSTSHAVTVSGLSNGNTYHYYVRCQDTATSPNVNTTDYEITFSVDSASQVAAPTASPVAGTFNSAQDITISTTTAGATIYYATVNTGPPSSNPTTVYTGPIHITQTTTISAVAKKSGMTDSVLLTAGYIINAASDTTPPTITNVTSNRANGKYGVGEVIDIDVTFSEAVTSSGNVSVILETGNTDRACTFTISNASFGTCNYTVQEGDVSADLNVRLITGVINDQSNNPMTNFVPATNLAANKAIVIDTTPPDTTAPGRSNGAPSGTLSTGTVQTKMTLSTNETATCKYSTTSGLNYYSMTGTFASTDSVNHYVVLAGLDNGSSYTYYVKCEDTSYNFNTNNDDYIISFSVANPTSSNNNVKSDKKKDTPSRSISQSKNNVKNGQTLIQRGKKFTKNSLVLLYFGKPGGGYYAPQRVITSSKGAFSVSYVVKKPVGKYGWYAVDMKTNKKSKTIYYKVK